MRTEDCARQGVQHAWNRLTTDAKVRQPIRMPKSFSKVSIQNLKKEIEQATSQVNDQFNSKTALSAQAD